MLITTARRINAMNSVDTVQRMMRCDKREATNLLAEARSTCAIADARRAVQQLNNLTDVLGMSTEQMLRAFA